VSSFEQQPKALTFVEGFEVIHGVTFAQFTPIVALPAILWVFFCAMKPNLDDFESAIVIGSFPKVNYYFCCAFKKK